MTLLPAFVAASLLAVVASTDAGAADSAEEAAKTNDEAEFGAPMGPPDPFNRGTPRGSMYGLAAAVRDGDFERAASFLDLRRLPAAEAESGAELARKLKTVLEQQLRVDFATLSNHNAGFSDDGLPAWQDRLGDLETRAGLVTLLLQRVPRSDDGTRIWKISSVTVARISDLYEEFGPGRLELWLPPVFFDTVVLRLALWQWLGLLLLPLFAWLVSLLCAGATIRLLASVVTRELDKRVVKVVRGPVRLAITVLAFMIGRQHLLLPTQLQDFLRVAESLLWVVAAAWFAFKLIDLEALVLRAQAERRGSLGIIPVLAPLKKFAKVLIVVFGTLGVLGTLGINITAAVAGLGVGGIAVALAAQKTLENLFGGVTLFADRPVRVGDFCRYGDQVGTVEEIGLRSTRVRTLDRTVISIPNAEFSNMPLENYALRDTMRLWTVIGVRYETTPDQLRFLLSRLRGILVAHPRVTDDPARVRFVGFGASSLDIEIFAYVNTREWSEFLEVREDIYLRLMDAVKESGSGFAFPSSTVYLGRDDGLSEERTTDAEAHVAQWRRQGDLPFPNLPDSERSRLHNTLAWPPEGSPGGPPHSGAPSTPEPDDTA